MGDRSVLVWKVPRCLEEAREAHDASKQLKYGRRLDGVRCVPFAGDLLVMRSTCDALVMYCTVLYCTGDVLVMYW
jgi:hypothetical protein